MLMENNTATSLNQACSKEAFADRGHVDWAQDEWRHSPESQYGITDTGHRYKNNASANRVKLKITYRFELCFRSVHPTASAALSSCRNNVTFNCRIIPIILDTISLTPLIGTEGFYHRFGQPLENFAGACVLELGTRALHRAHGIFPRLCWLETRSTERQALTLSSSLGYAKPEEQNLSYML
ncbi:hypothetical protein BS47DRAFT_1360092 [Hydnum rufescens UP504]|uniref:Uncharacterized protein n=1 Tax=Hydnum rufescens UP504 TaxID=1448309 RepID=A0A9P6E038_9AGAM|nr:hypothetical protein BS47DRAFT_1360092 [Hydnum rufescens UP504]